MNKKTKNLIELHIATFILGSNGIFVKLIPLSSATLIFWRSLIAAVALGLLLLVRKDIFFLKSIKDYLSFLLLGILVALHWVAFFKAIQLSGIAIGYLALFTYPVITVFLEPILTKQKIHLADLISGILVFIGILVIVPELSFTNTVTQGVLYGILSALFYSIRNITCRPYVKKYSGLLLMFYQLVITFLILIPFAPLVIHFSQKDIFLLLILGVIGTAIAHTLLANSLESLKAKTISIVGTLQIPYSFILAALLVHELPNFKTLIGAVIIMIAVLLEMKRQSTPQEVLG